ncbi:F-box protein At3g07870-like [Papaver somniferum]|uniref:F-box protein At3g07870-like n=1 Tax=Papaver somniferum TaxID=3469 RepID=UPI000E703E0E|nr:F-box protein At3g07870-like [Papaver somniferum]
MGKFSDLPAEIMLDIFTRLPTESVLDCKSVSKSWRNVIHHRSFSHMHSNILLSNPKSVADSGKLRFVCKMVGGSLCYLEYDDEVSSYRFKKLELSPPFNLYSILGSYNSLVCINGLPSHYTMDESSTASYVAYICNPITRESITLPELDRSTYYHLVWFMSSVFGYVASTNEYKVVRLYTFWRSEFANIEVYTLGIGKLWRNAGKIKVSDSMSRRHAVFVDGFLYWNFGNGRMQAFDLDNGVFVELNECWNGHFWGGVLGGHYSGTRYSKDGKSVDVWLLKKKEDESISYSKEFSLINMDSYPTPLSLTSNGTVLCYSDTKLHLHDLKSSSSKVLGDFGRRIHPAVPHMNTLVSLKAFGEETTETLKPGEAIKT